MNRTLLFVSVTLAAAGGAVVACMSTDSAPSSPALPPVATVKDSGVRDGASAAETGAPAEGGAVADGSTDSGNTVVTDAGDAGSVVVGTCSATDAGYVTLAADWGFAVSAATLNGGKGQLLSVHVCDSVVWTNKDTVSHSIVSNPGEAFQFTTISNAGGAYPPLQFTKAGTFGYQCGIHGTMMIGQITVNP